MALVIDLKPHEKILIGTAVISNDRQRTRLHISGDTPILREKDILQEEDANTPCKKIYFLIQCMYLSPDPGEYHERYFSTVREVQKAAPSCSLFFMPISDHILEGHYYKALKKAKELIRHEEELIENALKQPS